eukprot:10949990-Karenia_brevis.AAC.1
MCKLIPSAPAQPLQLARPVLGQSVLITPIMQHQYLPCKLILPASAQPSQLANPVLGYLRSVER